MKGEFRVNGTKNPHLMTALGIKQERCHELCGLISDILKTDRELTLAEVISEASEHCETANELAFVSCVAGENFAVNEMIAKSVLSSYFTQRN